SVRTGPQHPCTGCGRARIAVRGARCICLPRRSRRKSGRLILVSVMRRGPVRKWWRVPGWLRQLAALGTAPSGSEELRLRKAVLTLSSTMMASLACVWVATYAVLGLWVSAAIPFAYQLATALSIWTFARSRRYQLYRGSQLWMSLVLPFALQWSLGGFRTASAVCLWGFTGPGGALVVVGPRPGGGWVGGFVGLVGGLGPVGAGLAASAPDIPNAVVVSFFVLNLIGPTTVAYVLLQYFVRAREQALVDLASQHHALELEQAKSERLLLNVLPEPVARRLKDHG